MTAGPTVRCTRRGLRYLFVRPAAAARGLLVVVHGQGRHAEFLAGAFAAEATNAGFAVLAPEFEKPRFARYHVLRDEDGPLGAAVALNEACGEVGAELGLPGRQVALLGFSAGAQFAHRYALAYPEHVSRLIVASAGWYTLPEASLAFPHGCAPSPDLPVGAMGGLDAFLRIPALVLVGADDVSRDRMLRTSSRLDELQGRHRLERAWRWVQQVRRRAREAGLTPCIEIEVLPRTGHSARAAVERGGLVPRALAFLGTQPSTFEPETTAASERARTTQQVPGAL